MCNAKLSGYTTRVNISRLQRNISSRFTTYDKMSTGLTFVVADDFNNKKKLQKMIEMLGGIVIPPNCEFLQTYNGIPDYGVVPVQGAPLNEEVNEIVTDLFIEDCTQQRQIIKSVKYYHRPLSGGKPYNLLLGCVLTISKYTKTEKAYLSALAKQLGAICQTKFTKKSDLQENLLGNTHLICSTPIGNQYNAAVEWKLPAVTADWLKTCADQSRFVDETPFLVGKTIAPNRPSTSASETTLKQTVSNIDENSTNVAEEQIISTRKRRLPLVKEISAVNISLKKKRVHTETPDSASPFHTPLSTPDSPHGQVFQPNPSPSTRKYWGKWAESFPNLQIKEPPLQQRKRSTPLPDLMGQLWEKLMNADQSKNTQEIEADQLNIDAPSISEPINQKLDFDEEDNEASTNSSNETNMQTAKLNQMLQQIQIYLENSNSISEKNTKKYNETSDNIEKCMIEDQATKISQRPIVWKDPNHPRQNVLASSTSRPSRNFDEENNQIINRSIESNNKSIDEIKMKLAELSCDLNGKLAELSCDLNGKLAELSCDLNRNSAELAESVEQILLIMRRNNQYNSKTYEKSTTKYNKTSDDIPNKCTIKDSQPFDAIVREDPNHLKQINTSTQTEIKSLPVRDHWSNVNHLETSRGCQIVTVPRKLKTSKESIKNINTSTQTEIKSLPVRDHWSNVNHLETSRGCQIVTVPRKLKTSKESIKNINTSTQTEIKSLPVRDHWSNVNHLETSRGCQIVTVPRELETSKESIKNNAYCNICEQNYTSVKHRNRHLNTRKHKKNAEEK